MKRTRERSDTRTQWQGEKKAEFSRDAAIKTTLRDPSVRATELNASESRSKQPSAEASSDNKARTAKPLETLMQMGAPELEKPGEHKTPYMQPPPYVRHFDTYTLMKDLHQGGFSEDQSVTTMKAVRGLLAVNLDIAKEGLFSKSDVENVNNTPFYAFPLFPTWKLPLSTPTLKHPTTSQTNHPLTEKPPETYLFRAACSELRTEILNTRKSTSTQTRPPPTHLRHPLPAGLAGDVLAQGRP